jgi:AAA+ superfamily predicted ATPase
MLHGLRDELNSFDQELENSDKWIADYLGLVDEQPHMVMSKTLPLSVVIPLSMHLEQLLEEEGTIDCSTNFDYDCEPISIANQVIEIGLNQSTSGICSGFFFVDSTEGRFVLKTRLEISPYVDPNDRYLIIFCRPKHAAVMAQLLERLKRRAIDLLPYRNHCVEMNHYGQVSFLDIPVVKDNDIILSDEQHEAIQLNIFDVMKHAKKLEKLGIRTSRGLILEGPPGTGKTMTGKWIWAKVKKLGMTMIVVTSKSLSAGEPAVMIKDVFDMAKTLSPAVVWMEDIDLIGRDRNEGGGAALFEVLQALDGLEDRGQVFVIASTNDPEVLDDALKYRPCRFDARIAYDVPTKKERMLLLDLFTRRLLKAKMLDQLPDWVIEESHGLTGAYLQEIVNMAAMTAVRRGDARVGDVHWHVALSSVQKGKELYQREHMVLGFGEGD